MEEQKTALAKYAVCLENSTQHVLFSILWHYDFLSLYPSKSKLTDEIIPGPAPYHFNLLFRCLLRLGIRRIWLLLLLESPKCSSLVG